MARAFHHQHTLQDWGHMWLVWVPHRWPSLWRPWRLKLPCRDVLCNSCSSVCSNGRCFSVAVKQSPKIVEEAATANFICANSGSMVGKSARGVMVCNRQQGVLLQKPQWSICRCFNGTCQIGRHTMFSLRQYAKPQVLMMWRVHALRPPRKPLVGAAWTLSYTTLDLFYTPQGMQLRRSCNCLTATTVS